MQGKKANANSNRAAFERIAARYILDKSDGFELRGSDQQVKTAFAALKESRALMHALRGSDLHEVRAQLERKRKAAGQFYKVYGYVWPF